MSNGSVRFTAVGRHGPGVIADLLGRSYAQMLAEDPEHWGPERANWAEFDRQVFENPDTIGRCVFVTCVDGEPVGLASFDPRQKPVGIVGHNCIVPEFRGRGLGRAQIQEVLRQLRERGFARAVVSTGQQEFFAPARRMYESCGFRETGRPAGGPNPAYELVEYELEM